MLATQTTFLRERPYLAVSLTHFFVDVLNSGRNLLVAVLAISMGLTNAQVGIALLLYNVGNALSQPLFGWLADRIGARLLVVGGMGWMIFFFTIASVAGDWVSLIALTIASVGSGAFHPTGTMVASQTTDQHRNKATAVFFMAGQVGLFAGPLLTGVLLDQYGRPGYVVLPALAFIAFYSGWQWLSSNQYSVNSNQLAISHQPPAISPQPPAPSPQPPTFFWRRLILLTTLILTSYTVGISIITYAPKLFTEIGYSAGYVGLLAGLFAIGGAAGGITGGVLADRIPGKWVVVLGMVGAALPVYWYIPLRGPLQPSLLLLAGFFTGMPHAILVLMVQSLFPGRRAMASGLALGFMFFSGAIGSAIVGVIADRITLAAAMQATAVLPLIAALIAALLPDVRRQLTT